MDKGRLEQITARLLAPGKGILAADESTGTANKRFAALNIPQDEETRRRWRELLFTAPGIETGLNGVILYDETMRQKDLEGTPLPEVLRKRGIIPGIKVDKGTVDLENFPGEKVTEGLDGLAARFKEYSGMGAEFAKWRAVIQIGDGIPTEACLDANALLLARYAAIAQEAGLVPIIEPEVLIDGTHLLVRSEEVLIRTLPKQRSELLKRPFPPSCPELYSFPAASHPSRRRKI
jgi:fructose-bisphosphate aldolase class I